MATDPPFNSRVDSRWIEVVDDVRYQALLDLLLPEPLREDDDDA